MLVLEIKQLKKYYGDRLILDIPDLKIYDDDKIGLIGLNGAGKTTLLEIIAGIVPPDEGEIKFYGGRQYITQLGGGEEQMSGGERTMAKIEEAFARESHLLMADEPTSNLSIRHVELLTEKLKAFDGGLLLISHDRELLNAVCNKILEIEDGHVTEYAGDYRFYQKEKSYRERNARQGYERYAREKERLEEAVSDIKGKANSMKKAPKRMGNSEARLHKNSIKARAKKVDRTSKKIEARLQALEEVKKPVTPSRTKIDIQEGTRLHAKVAIEASRLSKRYGTRVLFEDVGFQIMNGSKTALVGENGAGKTTLVKMLVEGGGGVKKAAGLKMAYFAQDLNILDEEKTIYENVAAGSAMSQTAIRSILSRMLFFRDDVFKKVGVISGGERVKVALAKIFCQDVNMLVLDEPNNYLDIFSMEALEGLICDYEGTILIVTHDKSLIRLADRLLVFENGQVVSFHGGYDEYNKRKMGGNRARECSNTLMRAEQRLAEIIGRLSAPGKEDDVETLDWEFKRLAAEIRQLKSDKKQ